MATEPEHAYIMTNYWDSFFSPKKRSPLSLGTEPAVFRYNGQRANHYTTTVLNVEIMLTRQHNLYTFMLTLTIKYCLERLEHAFLLTDNLLLHTIVRQRTTSHST